MPGGGMPGRGWTCGGTPGIGETGGISSSGDPVVMSGAATGAGPLGMKPAVEVGWLVGRM